MGPWRSSARQTLVGTRTAIALSVIPGLLAACWSALLLRPSGSLTGDGPADWAGGVVRSRPNGAQDRAEASEVPSSVDPGILPIRTP